MTIALTRQWATADFCAGIGEICQIWVESSLGLADGNLEGFHPNSAKSHFLLLLNLALSHSLQAQTLLCETFDIGGPMDAIPYTTIIVSKGESMKRLWSIFIAIFALSFAVLGWVGSEIFRQMPPNTSLLSRIAQRGLQHLLTLRAKFGANETSHA
jgi:hypothetical protein